MLSDRMGTTEFEFFMHPEPKGVMRMLVYVEDSTDLDSGQLDLLPRMDNPSFVHGECRAWRLKCCEGALLADWPYWRRFLDQDDNYPSGDGLAQSRT